ncbi:MAG: hypothetical protein AAGB04_32115, partial [Pseudomonadota bacterium]
NDNLTPRDSVIPAGEAAPDFTLLDQDRNEFKLSDALEKGEEGLYHGGLYMLPHEFELVKKGSKVNGT